MLLKGKTNKSNEIFEKIVDECVVIEENHPAIGSMDLALAHKVIMFYKFLAEVSPKTQFTISVKKASYIYLIGQNHGLKYFTRLLTFVYEKKILNFMVSKKLLTARISFCSAYDHYCIIEFLKSLIEREETMKYLCQTYITILDNSKQYLNNQCVKYFLNFDNSVRMKVKNALKFRIKK